MSTPKQAELFQEREERLCCLLASRAPSVIIKNECVLVARAFHGGRWHLVWYLLKEATRWAVYWRLYAPLRELMCRRLGVHYRDDSGFCYVCSTVGVHDQPDAGA